VRLDSGGGGARGGSADFDDEEVGGCGCNAETTEGFGDLGVVSVSMMKGFLPRIRRD